MAIEKNIVIGADLSGLEKKLEELIDLLKQSQKQADKTADAVSEVADEVKEVGESAKEGAKVKKNWLNKGTEQWDKAIAYIQKGGNIADIQKKYAISKDNLAELQAI